MRVDEAVYVATDKVGDPIGFNWRGIAYLVKTKPVRWFARREWWVEAARVQRGIGAGVVEVEMWRLQASPSIANPPGNGSGGQFELIKSADSNVWRLVRVWQ
ncbi:MAG: hypothetical protein RL645_567 [Actinomycetota bacterium]|jgi:hypothetical protein